MSQRHIAVLSLLHQPARGHSAELRLLGEPVLRRTLSQVAKAGLSATVIVWDDQAAAARDAVGGLATVVSQGPRLSRPAMDAISAALRWSDGWRTTLARCCAFDAGFDAPAVLTAMGDANAAVLVDPASPLLLPSLLTGLTQHAATHADRDWFYLPTPPGQSAALIRKASVQELARTRRHPGLALHYHPDRFGADPVSTPHCAPAPTPLCRSLANFRIDRPDQLGPAEMCLREGDDLTAETLLARWPPTTTLPRDLRLELTTTRRARPVFLPTVPAATASLATVKGVLEQIHPRVSPDAGLPAPVRLTLGNVGDPLAHPQWPAVLAAAAERGIPVCIETDLVGLSPDQLQPLITSRWDVLHVHLPAASRSTYAKVMGVDAFEAVMSALEMLVRQTPGRLVVPLFTQLADNLAEVEPWYDHFIRTLAGSGGGGVVQSASTYAGRVPDLGAPDLAPPARTPCKRLMTRLTVLACGTPAACENDLSHELLPPIPSDLWQAWSTAMPALRERHRTESDLPERCRNCRDFFRP